MPVPLMPIDFRTELFEGHHTNWGKNEIMPKSTAAAQATSRLSEAVAQVDFDSKLAVQVAGLVFEGVEELGLRRKANEIQIALVQRNLEITAEQIAAYRSGRATVEQQFAPSQEVSEAAVQEAAQHVVAVKETVHCERASLYTAVLIDSGVEAAEQSFNAAKAALAAAEQEARVAEQQFEAARTRRFVQIEELARQLADFDDRYALIVAFLEWSEHQRTITEDPHAEYGPATSSPARPWRPHYATPKW